MCLGVEWVQREDFGNSMQVLVFGDERNKDEKN